MVQDLCSNVHMVDSSGSKLLLAKRL